MIKIESNKFVQLLKSSLCWDCLGCNKLELTYFTGTKKCKRYVKARYTEQTEMEVLL